MINKILISFRVCLLVLGSSALIAHNFLPLKQQDLLALMHNPTVYADEVGGGNSKVIWIDKSNLHFRCEVNKGLQHTYCGIALRFKTDEFRNIGIDIESFSHLVLDLEHSGENNSKLNLFYRNSDFTEYDNTIKNFDRDQYIYTYIDTLELDDPLKINLDNFTLADWWLDQNYKNRDQIRHGRENIVEIGISTASGAPFGIYEFKLRGIKAIGEWISKEVLYFYTLLLFIFIIVFESLLRAAIISRDKRVYQQSYAKLSKVVSHLEVSANQDALTTLLNRSGLQKEIKRLSILADGSHYYIFLFDLDHFKSVNDKYGHDGGDLVLVEFSKLIRRMIRKSDILARWGGEEFLLISSHKSDENALLYANKLCNATERNIINLSNNQTLKLTTSIGVSKVYQEQEFESALKLADIKLYKAKDRGRNCVVF